MMGVCLRSWIGVCFCTGSGIVNFPKIGILPIVGVLGGSGTVKPPMLGSLIIGASFFFCFGDSVIVGTSGNRGSGEGCFCFVGSFSIVSGGILGSGPCLTVFFCSVIGSVIGIEGREGNRGVDVLRFGAEGVANCGVESLGAVNPLIAEGPITPRLEAILPKIDDGAEVITDDGKCGIVCKVVFVTCIPIC